MNEASYPVLYILMRTDLPSMNTGKGFAQASHAAHAFSHDMLVGKFPNSNAIANNDSLFRMWKATTPQGFGTVLVLGVNEREMRSAVEVAQALYIVSGVVHDPTYPVRIPPELGMALVDVDVEHDSDVTVGDGFGYATIPLDTCAYVFGLKGDPMLEAVVGRYPLHP